MIVKYNNISQGTISILFGCHSIVHSILVLISWIKLYKKFPKFWQLICIFLHDIGHTRLNYLDDYEQKKKHWILGSNIAMKLFGKKGYDFVAGHDTHSNVKRSLLYKPDKYSWYIAPKWWLYLTVIFEPKLLGNKDRIIDAVNDFKKRVVINIETNTYQSTHEIYIERCK